MKTEHSADLPLMVYPWQASQWQHLTRLLNDRKLPHALLLAGPAGTGKLHFAQRLAALLLCLSPHNQMACGRCKGCDLLKVDTHPDRFMLQPEGTSRVIKVDQVREVTEFLSKTAQQGGRKVAILAPAEALNANAANALLKSLEEPAGESVLLLVSHAPRQLMATIRSRCQLLQFPLPLRDVSLKWLSPLATGQDPQELLRCAGDAPLAALGLLSGDTLEQRRELLKILTGIAHSRVSSIDAAASCQTMEPLSVMEWLMLWVQAGVKGSAAVTNLDPASLESELVDWLAEVPAPILFRFWDKLVILKRQLLSSANPNKLLLLEELMLDWQALMRQSRRGQQSRQQMMDGLV